MSRFRPMVSRRTPSTSSFAEMFLAPGPQAIGQTGDNSYGALFGRDWLLLWGRDDDVLSLYQEQGGAWVEVVDELPPVFGSPAPGGSRRWSVAFDQSARVIVAYEDAEGVVRVTRWDPGLNQYVQNVTFAGVDPCVVMDASWSYRVPGSDVLLFYLSPDRTRVLCRVQRDVYAVEHEIWDYGTPIILDRVIALPYKYQVLVADASGAPLPDVLVSDMYPVAVTTGVGLEAEFLGGEYRQVAYQYEPLLGVELAPAFVGGALTLPVVEFAPAIAVNIAGQFTSGELTLPVTKHQPLVTGHLEGRFTVGALEEIGKRVEPHVTAVISGEFVGGTYEPS